MKKISSIGLLSTIMSLTVWAAPVDDFVFDAHQQQRQMDKNKALEQQQVKQPDVHLKVDSLELTKIPTSETPCFPIHKLIITDYSSSISDYSSIPTHQIPPSQFSSALSAVNSFDDFHLPQCLGGKGLNALLKRIQNHLIGQGFATTRVLLQPQDLSSKRVVITVIPGKINRLQIQDHSPLMPFVTKATRWFAMPLENGDVLNIRDLEQGLENLKRNSSTDADIQIQPTEQIGESDVIISYQQGFPLHLTLGLDDSGTKATGRLQGSATLSFDNPFTLNDLFYVNVTKGIKRHSDGVDGDRGSKNISLYYSVPWKYWLFTLSGSQYDYFQTVAGAYQDYEYSGKSRQLKASLGRILYRDNHHKTFASISLWARKSFNYVNDTEVEVQRRRMAGWQAELSHTEYLGNATFQAKLGYKRGTGLHHSLRAPEENFGEGTSRPKIITADLQLSYPFMFGAHLFRFASDWHGQWNKTPLIQQDKLSIGGRYSVRGFDGELSLSGERGWIWRNEFSVAPWNKGQEWYVALDKGMVRDRLDEQLGHSLIGWATGIRGNLFGLNYDYFIGTPIHKPSGFRTSHAVTGFNFSYKF